MKTRPAALPAPTPGDPPGFPGTGELAALRAWYTGLAVRPAVERYLPSALGNGQSARGVLGRIRRKLVTLAHTAHRGDLATLPGHPTGERQRHAKAVAQAIDTLRTARAPQAHRITTLAELTVRIPRRRQWWKAVPGLGVASARAIEAFFAAWPALTDKARALVVAGQRGGIVPWESLNLPHEVDGSQGTFRAPAASCTLDAANDYGAVQTWLALHGSPATQRTYRRRPSV